MLFTYNTLSLLLSSLAAVASGAALHSPASSSIADHGLSRREENTPPSDKATGFKLVANATDLTHLFSATIHRWSLTGVRTSPGVYTSVLFQDVRGISPSFNNGTTEEIAARNGTIQSDLYPPSQPIGLVVEPIARYLPNAERVFWLGTKYGSGTPGLGIDEDGVLYGPEKGSFIVCHESVGTSKQYVVSWLIAKTLDGGTEVVLPDECVAITLLASCGELPDLPAEGVEYSHDFAREVPCGHGLAYIDPENRKM